ncbi:MAG: hypothetical protein KDB46_03285 [Solirubrobacterales bacterium]|nr:hypothetical protein [Solirubrobacterales bacterium]
MYQFSRSIYRELAPRIAETSRAGCTSKQQILDACEGTMRRLLTDRRYFARPTKSLFSELRGHFPISEQLFVFQVVDRNVKLALRYLDEVPAEELAGLVERECKAHTRRGTPCQREPLPGRDYCPSHKHLEEDVVIDEAELVREEDLQLIA